jgi:hypothetical protein
MVSGTHHRSLQPSWLKNIITAEKFSLNDGLKHVFFPIISEKPEFYENIHEACGNLFPQGPRL